MLAHVLISVKDPVYVRLSALPLFPHFVTQRPRGPSQTSNQASNMPSQTSNINFEIEDMVHVGVVWTNIKSRSERGCQRAFPILRSIGKAWLWFCTLLTVWDCLCFGDLQLTGTVIVIVPRWIGSFHSNVIPPNFTVDPESGLSKQRSISWCSLSFDFGMRQQLEWGSCSLWKDTRIDSSRCKYWQPGYGNF